MPLVAERGFLPVDHRHPAYGGLRETVYAIGDVHGETPSLDRLIAIVQADVARRLGPATLVFVGDLNDRGPDSIGAIDRVMALTQDPPPGLSVRCIQGNHEALLVEHLSGATDALQPWLDHGGEETLESLGVPLAPWEVRRHWVAEALGPRAVWLAGLPRMIRIGDLVIVHAGIEPAVPLDAQDPEVLIWFRGKRFMRKLDLPWIVVHGHTPTPGWRPEVAGSRIGIDTGACYGGPLTAARLGPDGLAFASVPGARNGWVKRP